MNRCENVFLVAALQALDAGLRPIPVEPGGKKPLVEWRVFQERSPNEDEIRD